MAGSKTAPAAMLKVLAPPTITRGPQETEEVIEGEGLDLACDVSSCDRFRLPFARTHACTCHAPGKSGQLIDMQSK